MAPVLFVQLRTFLEDKYGRDRRTKPYRNMLDALHINIGAIERVIGTATPEQIVELEGLRRKEDEVRSKIEAIYNSKRITFRIDPARLDPRILEEMRAEHMGVHCVKKRTNLGNDEDSVRSKRILVSGDDKNLRQSKRIRKTPDRPGIVKMHGEEEDDAYDEGELTQEQTDEKIAELRSNTVLAQGDSGTFYSSENDYEDEDMAHQNDECEMNSEAAAAIEAIETFANDETYSSDDKVQALDERGVDTRLSRNRHNKPHDRILRRAMKEAIGLEPEPETLLSDSDEGSAILSASTDDGEELDFSLTGSSDEDISEAEDGETDDRNNRHQTWGLEEGEGDEADALYQSNEGSGGDFDEE